MSSAEKPKRRKFLIGSLGVASGTLFLSKESGTVIPQANAQSAPEKSAYGSAYEPAYFTPAEYAFITAAADRLIPANADGPGAVELHVPEFIDRQMETDYGHGARWYLQGPFHPEADFSLGYQLRFNPRDLYRTAIAEINKSCQDTYSKAFSEMDPTDQDKVLTALQKGQLSLPSVKSDEFFIQLLANTKEGYFADPMYGGNLHMGSWKMIGFPGARADFKDWESQYNTVYPLGPVSIKGEGA